MRRHRLLILVLVLCALVLYWSLNLARTTIAQKEFDADLRPKIPLPMYEWGLAWMPDDAAKARASALDFVLDKTLNRSATKVEEVDLVALSNKGFNSRGTEKRWRSYLVSGKVLAPNEYGTMIEEPFKVTVVPRAEFVIGQPGVHLKADEEWVCTQAELPDPGNSSIWRKDVPGGPPRGPQAPRRTMPQNAAAQIYSGG